VNRLIIHQVYSICKSIARNKQKKQVRKKEELSPTTTKSGKRYILTCIHKKTVSGSVKANSKSEKVKKAESNRKKFAE
jgi:hypothetical protein